MASAKLPKIIKHLNHACQGDSSRPVMRIDRAILRRSSQNAGVTGTEAWLESITDSDGKERAFVLTHLKAFFVDHYHTGAVLPSSAAFARMMTREARQADGPRRILEVGPGAGPMTEQICKSLRADDVFDVVEINPEFAAKVERQYLTPTRKRLPGAHIQMHVAPIQTADLGGNYDFLVCSLPFNNFDPELVRVILARFRELLAPTGQWCFFEYAGLRKFVRAFKSASDKKRLDAISEIFKEIDKDPGLRKEICWFNVPPATKRRVIPTAGASQG